MIFHKEDALTGSGITKSRIYARMWPNILSKCASICRYVALNTDTSPDIYFSWDIITDIYSHLLEEELERKVSNQEKCQNLNIMQLATSFKMGSHSVYKGGGLEVGFDSCHSRPEEICYIYDK